MSETHQTWSCTVTVPCVPTCPVCGAALHPRAVALDRDLVTCNRCQVGNVPMLHYAMLAIRDPLSRRVVTIADGLRFYTPVRDGLGHQPLATALAHLNRLNGISTYPPLPERDIIDAEPHLL